MDQDWKRSYREEPVLMTRVCNCNDTLASLIEVIAASPDSWDCKVFEDNKWRCLVIYKVEP